MLLGVLVLGGLLTPCFADGPPVPDPAGTATGDRNSTLDAAGNPFVVPAPPDPSAPDYADKKKAYDEYQAQLAKEPLAAKLADHVGHTTRWPSALRGRDPAYRTRAESYR